jgi:sirohydrochlorin ferrochelatase
MERSGCADRPVFAGGQDRLRRRSGGGTLLLVAHGSRDPRAACSTRALARAVGAARAGTPVTAAFLDFETPRVPAALAAMQEPRVTVVPLLLTAAYHGRVDMPRAVAEAGAPVTLAEVLGPVAGATRDARALDLIVSALCRRLAAATGSAGPSAVRGGFDGIVLAAAGTRDVPALATVDLVANEVSARLRVPCRPGYASGHGPSVDEAVGALRRDGVRRPALAAYFLAPGLLYDRVAAQAHRLGVAAVAAPLDDAPEIVDLVLLRAESCTKPTEPVLV